MKPVNSGTPAMRRRLASGYVHDPTDVLKISITVPTAWKIRMTFASSHVSSLNASISAWIATAPMTRKS